MSSSVKIEQGRLYAPDVEWSLSQAKSQTPLDADTFIPQALAVTRERCSRARPGSQTRLRLARRTEDLMRLERYFKETPKAKLLHVVGFGEGCSVPHKPRDGISQYDAVEYVDAEGKKRVERLGSAYGVYKTRASGLSEPQKKNLTTGGWSSKWVDEERSFLRRHVRGMSDSGVAEQQHHEHSTCGHAHGDHAHTHAEAARKGKDGDKPHKHHHHGMTGVCVCGRGVAAAVAPSSEAQGHQDESGFEHALEQVKGGRLEPSVLGLALGAVFLCVKLPLDIYNACKMYALSKVFKTLKKEGASTDPQPQRPVAQHKHERYRHARATLKAYPYRLAQSAVFYTGAFSVVIGHVQGILSAGAGAFAVGLGALAFGFLGFVSFCEGVYGLCRIRRVRVEKSELFQRAMDKHVRVQRAKAAMKCVGGACMVVGLFVPGAQPLVVLGAFVLMAPAVWAACVWGYRKWIKPVPHVHLHGPDICDATMRAWTFSRMLEVKRVCKEYANKADECGKDTDKENTQRREFAEKYHVLMRNDAEKRMAYLEKMYKGSEDDKDFIGMWRGLREESRKHHDALKKTRTSNGVSEWYSAQEKRSLESTLRMYSRGQDMLLDQLCGYTFDVASVA